MAQPGLNDMWQQFTKMNEHLSDQSSTMDTPRIDTLTSLIHNPTRHVVQKLMDDKTYERVKEEKLLKELAEVDKAQKELEIEKQLGQNAKEQKKVEFEKRKKETERIRREAEHRRRISESESNGSYAEILAQQEQRKRKEVSKAKKEKNITNECTQNKNPMNSTDTLYSIPEDTSFDQSPAVQKSSPSKIKSKQNRHRNVIDPLMLKLHDKVKHQREKIDKERRKELKRMDKLKKLELLLNAKKKGRLSDKAIDVELEMVSSTTLAGTTTDSSTMLDTDVTSADDTLQSSNEVTVDSSSKDSSSVYEEQQMSPVRKAYLQRLSAKQAHEHKEYSSKKASDRQVSFDEPKKTKKTKEIFADSDSQNEMDSIFDRPRSERLSTKKTRKSRKHKDDNDIFAEQSKRGQYKHDAMFTEKSKTKSQMNKENIERFLSSQLDADWSSRGRNKSPILDAYNKKYKSSSQDNARVARRKSPAGDRVRQSSRSPEHQKRKSKSPSSRKSRDTMGSPIVISPPSRRKKSKNVYMVSEAVQTSPYVPDHNERGVRPVPLMSPDRRQRRPSPSPVRKSPAREAAKSPNRLRSRPNTAKYRSPVPSPSRSRADKSPQRSRSRERKRSPSPERWAEDVYVNKGKPPPKSRIFTPETPDDTCIATLKDSPHSKFNIALSHTCILLLHSTIWFIERFNIGLFIL